jgi:RNA polymerase sigma factor (sigma-70 family)
VTHPGTPASADAPRPPLASPTATRLTAAGPAPGEDGYGDEREFACFYLKYFRRLVAYLAYQGAAAQVAADIAQDAMIVAYQRWSEVTFPKNYVYKVAYRAFVRHALDDPEMPVDEVPTPTTALPRPGEAETWLQEQEIIRLLRALPPRQRQVFALTVDGWPPAEIAELLEIAPEAVRANLKKARRSADEFRRRTGEEGP